MKYIPFSIPIFFNGVFLLLLWADPKNWGTLKIFIFQGMPFLIIGFLWQYYGRISTKKLKLKNIKLYRKYLRNDGSGYLKYRTYKLLNEQERKRLNVSLLSKIKLFYYYGISVVFTFLLTGLIWFLQTVL